MTMTLEQQLRRVAKNSYENDKAIVKLCDVLVAQVTDLQSHTHMMQQQILRLQEQTLELAKQLETLVAIQAGKEVN